MHQIRLTPIALIAVAILSLGAVASACGGGDDGGNGGGGGPELTLEDYFQQLGEIDDTFSAEADAIETASGGTAASLEDEEATLNLLADDLGKQLDLVDAFISDVADLNPPAEAQEAHDEAVAAFRELAGLLENVIDEVGNAESMADLEAIDDTELTAADERVTEACLAVEQIAADNDIDVDLDCVE